MEKIEVGKIQTNITAYFTTCMAIEVKLILISNDTLGQYCLFYILILYVLYKLIKKLFHMQITHIYSLQEFLGTRQN